MLFLIREDENEREYSEAFHKDKYNDVTTSGVDYKDFFTLSMNILPGLLGAYKEISQATMSETAKLIQELTATEKRNRNKTILDKTNNRYGKGNRAKFFRVETLIYTRIFNDLYTIG